jgi:23S rRNA (guanosine2251-2'-O)-methyltransferase
VAELLAARRRRTIDVWLSQDLDPAPVLTRIEDLAGAAGVPVRKVSRARLEAEAATDAPQGVLAHAQPLPESELDDLCRPPQGIPFLLALDGVTDPHNLGTLLRSAEAAGATGAVLARHRAVHVTPTVAKELGCWIVGLAGDAEGSLFDDLAVADQPLVLVVGAEGAGLSRLARARCDLVLRIPMRGRLPSLNVSAAGALALFEVSRRR